MAADTSTRRLTAVLNTASTSTSSHQSETKALPVITLVERRAAEFKALPVSRAEIGGSSQDIQHCQELATGDKWVVKCGYNAMAMAEALEDLSVRVGRILTPYYEEYKEWLGMALYQLLGIPTPQMAVCQFLPAATAPENQTEGLNYEASCLHLMSKFMPGFREYGKGIGAEFLSYYRVWALTQPGYFQFKVVGTDKTVPLKGFGAMLAVACFIYDLDCVGNSCGNVGFRIQSDNQGEYAETIKIDPGFAFSFLDENATDDPRERKIRYGTLPFERQAPVIGFAELTLPDQIEFAETARRILQIPRHIFANLIQQVVRPGAFTQIQANHLLEGLMARKGRFLVGYADDVDTRLKAEIMATENAMLANYAERRRQAGTTVTDPTDRKRTIPMPLPKKDKKEEKEGKTSDRSVTSTTISTASSTSSSSSFSSVTMAITPSSATLSASGLGLSTLIANLAHVQTKVNEDRAALAVYVTRDKKTEAKKAKVLRVFQKPPTLAHFTGRETLLLELAATLHSGRGGVISQGVSGLGGVGKTQLAAQYVALAAQGGSLGGQSLRYQGIVWLHAEQAMGNQLCALAESWSGERDLTPEQALIAVCRYCQQRHEPVLWVFDNAEEASHLEPILKALQGGHHHILITSRQLEWTGVPVLKLAGFTQEEGRAYIKKHLPTVTNREMDALLNTVSNLPLALAHAIAYIQAGHCTLAEYPTQFALHQLTLGQTVRAQDTTRTIMTTFTLSMVGLLPRYPAVEDILKACAYLDPDRIPIDLLKAGLLGTPPTHYTAEVAQTSLEVLIRQNLLQSNSDGTVSIHRIVQEAMRGWHQTVQTRQEIQQHQLHWLQCLGKILSYSTKNRADIARVAPFISHVEYFTHGFIPKNPQEQMVLDTLLSQLKDYQSDMVQYRQAQQFLEGHLALQQKRWGAKHPETARVLSSLAIAYSTTADKAKEAALRQEIRLLTTQSSVEEVDADVLTNQGQVLHEAGRFAEALINYDESLKVRPGHADTLFLRGKVLKTLNNPTGALANYDEALRIQPGHVAALYHRREALEALERPEEALMNDVAFCEEFLKKRAEAPPETVLAALSQYGVALYKLGRYEAALTSFEELLKLEPEPFSKVEMLWSGSALYALERYEAALGYYEKFLKIHPRHVSALIHRGRALEQLDRSEEALASFEEALEIEPKNAEALWRQGCMLEKLGRSEEALASFDEALEIEPENADILCQRGTVLAQLDRLAEALASFEEGLKVEPADELMFLGRAATLRSLGRVVEALESIEEALKIQPGDVSLLRARGVLLEDLRRPVEALASYDEALLTSPNDSLTLDYKAQVEATLASLIRIPSPTKTAASASIPTGAAHLIAAAGGPSFAPLATMASSATVTSGVSSPTSVKPISKPPNGRCIIA